MDDDCQCDDCVYVERLLRRYHLDTLRLTAYGGGMPVDRDDPFVYPEGQGSQFPLWVIPPLMALAVLVVILAPPAVAVAFGIVVAVGCVLWAGAELGGRR